MKRIYQPVMMLSLVLLMTGLCGCPPLAYKTFIRNTGVDTANLTLICTSPYDTITRTTVPVKSAPEILKINHKTISRLNEQLTATVERERTTLAIPPGTTVNVSELVWMFSLFTDKTLVIQHGGQSDTMLLHYPYKELKDVIRKHDITYTYFYRTLICHDIR